MIYASINRLSPMTMSAVSSTFLSALPHALDEERHFALAEKQLPVPTKARS